MTKLDLSASPSLKEQAFFFVPLAMTSLVITVTHSLFNAGLARLPEPEILLAAFAVAKSLLFIFYSPLMMVRQAVTALIDHRQNFKKTTFFLAAVVLFVIAFMSLFAFSDLSRFIFARIMGLSGPTLEQAVLLFKILVLFPICVSIRDFFAGFSIKFRTTPLITFSSLMRVTYVLILILLIDHLKSIPEAYVAGILYIGAVGLEALIMVLGTRVLSGGLIKGLVKLEKDEEVPKSKILNYNQIQRFYSPLVITALIQTSLMPIINSGLARTSDPDLTLAVFAVAWGLGVILLSPFMMFHQVSLNYIESKQAAQIKSVKRFGVILAAICSGLLLLIGITDIGYLILRHVIGTSHRISVLAADVLILMSVLPWILVAREYYWGILLKRRTTNFIWKGKAINLITLIAVISFLTILGLPNPAVNGVIGMIACELTELLYLYRQEKKAI